MKQAKSIEHIKRVGEFFPKGSMVRQSLLSVKPRSQRPRLRAACDMWRVSTKGGHVYLAESPHCKHMFLMHRAHNCVVTWGVSSFFADNCGLTDSDWLASFNNALVQLNGEGAKCT